MWSTVYKVVTRSSFGVTWQHKVTGGIGHFITVSQLYIQTWSGSWRTEMFCPVPITANYTAYSLLEIQISAGTRRPCRRFHHWVKPLTALYYLYCEWGINSNMCWYCIGKQCDWATNSVIARTVLFWQSLFSQNKLLKE